MSFGAGMGAGMGAGVGAGMAMGKSAGRKEAVERIGNYLEQHQLAITDARGKDVPWETVLDEVDLCDGGCRTTACSGRTLFLILGLILGLILLAGVLAAFLILR